MSEYLKEAQEACTHKNRHRSHRLDRMEERIPGITSERIHGLILQENI